MSESPRPLALLWHRDPRRQDHFDLLLSTLLHPSPEMCCALSWRSTHRITTLEPGGTITIEPIAMHRAAYLELTGPTLLDGGRGAVEPIALGRWQPRDDGSAGFAWTPHAPQMIVRFFDAKGAVDARDEGRLSTATSMRREAAVIS